MTLARLGQVAHGSYLNVGAHGECGSLVLPLGPGCALNAPLSRQLELEVGEAAHVEPGAAGGADQPEHDLVTGRAAGDHPRSVRVDAGLPHRAGGPARDALPGGRGDIDREQLAQRPGEHVSVQVRVHVWPPEGPKRSVLMVCGAWPASTSRSAAPSTNPVGPQTNTASPGCAGFPAVRMSVLIRPAGSGQPGGVDRV